MLWTQRLIVFTLLAAALVYLGRRAWLSLTNAVRARRADGCGPSCGCGGAPNA